MIPAMLAAMLYRKEEYSAPHHRVHRQLHVLVFGSGFAAAWREHAPRPQPQRRSHSRQQRMEPFRKSQAVATSGNRWQMVGPLKGRK